jgi:uncharacterized protein (TIGR00296 family)
MRQGQNNMSFQLTIEDGKFLVNLARRAVTVYLENGKLLQVPKNVPLKLMEKCGVFVTLNQVYEGEKALRGCIGLPYPTAPLSEAVIEAALSAATQDPRFPKVTLDELDNIVFEVSILTPPQHVEVEKTIDYPQKIKVGRDGLIIERSYCKGLLLPQVPVELEWGEEEFLCQCSIKAGLPPDSWLLKDAKIYSFQAIIFEEVSPKGQIKLKKI